MAQPREGSGIQFGGVFNTYSATMPELAAKRVELLKETLPDLTKAGAPDRSGECSGQAYVAAMKLAAQLLKLELSEFAVRASAIWKALSRRWPPSRSAHS